jgi:NitT/TauT family transport system permease protein
MVSLAHRLSSWSLIDSRIAIAPLLLIWFGIDSIWSKVMIVFLVAFFPMVVNSVVGFSQIDADLLDLAKTMGIKAIHRVSKDPAAQPVPYFRRFQDLHCPGGDWRRRCRIRLGPERARLSCHYRQNELNAALIFASITVLSVMSLGLFGIIVALEKALMPWRRGIYPTEL